ncbi:ABC transporter ATP-binding protein [Ruminiclostridium papyrosolvens]|uniref:Multidrug ABC transporter ATP-binding protein n=1 Tax=Ruminiclostridium papyrosolvens C7 TaxID=1330534 RepID=U4R2I9_9FIRM|nr:ABC transporter ATP-binding protein [Ruminiclostridium papyrosolvens]EPR12701.1 multidrug ABC transporter ATP-binding protein [Ruminiclostridium papyrosolvens C7]
MAGANKPGNIGNMPGLGSRMGGPPHQRFQPMAKPKNSKGTMIRLISMFGKWKGSLLVAAVLTIISASVSLITPFLIGQAINTFNIKTGTVDKNILTIILTALIACYLVSWIIDTSNGILMARVTQNLVKSIRTDFFSKLQRIPLNFYDTRAHGDTMSRITNDVDNISSTVAQTTTQLISSIFSITGSFIMMLYLSPVLTLVALITIPLVFILTKTIAQHSRIYFKSQQNMLGVLNGVIEENIVGLKMVKSFNRQQKVLEEFKEVNGKLCEYSTKAQIWAGFLMPFMNVINNLSFTFIACAGGVLTVNKILTVGVVVSFLTYSKQFGMPLNNIAGMFNTIQSALAGAERVFEILDEDEEAADKKNIKDFSDIKGKVEFTHVSFAYNAARKVLNNISFQVQPGEVVALVGETGAGKTTIVNLLTRFYETNEGEILIDDTNITDISRRDLRSCFSVVLQDTCLFTGTIMDNIRYSKPEATDEEVMEASKMAHAHEFISRLPKKYNTHITGSSDNLSQGQRQLIAIARAVLCNAPILILDEATSSVDTKTEKEIQLALLKLMTNHTSFLIAHRLSTIRDADKIFVIGNGCILEHGTHLELMDRKGIYYKMVINQMGLGENCNGGVC